MLFMYENSQAAEHSTTCVIPQAYDRFMIEIAFSAFLCTVLFVSTQNVTDTSYEESA